MARVNFAVHGIAICAHGSEKGSGEPPPFARSLTGYQRHAMTTQNGETMLRCQECGTEITYRGTGRKPRYCKSHQRGKSAMRRLRARNTERPQCCKEADGRQLKCPQHKEPTVRVAERNHFDDYGTAVPKGRHRADDSKRALFIDACASGFSIISRESLRIPTREYPPTQEYSDGSGPIPVTGQRDVDAYWELGLDMHTVNPDWFTELDAYVPNPRLDRAIDRSVGIIRRGPDWDTLWNDPAITSH